MVTQIQEVTEPQVQSNQSLDFGDIVEDLQEAIARLEKLINDYNNWERYWCEGDCSHTEYEEAAQKRIETLRKVVFGLMVDSGAHRQLISTAVDEF